MPISLNAPEIGECIYCGTRDERPHKEHAVPYGLNGPWTLLKASCGACAAVTRRGDARIRHEDVVGMAEGRERASHERQVREEILRLSDAGWRVGRIAKKLNADGERTRRGCLWHPQSVARVLHA